MSSQARWWVGLVASVVVAFAGQAEVFPEPYRHLVSALGIAATAASGYMLQRPIPQEKD